MGLIKSLATAGLIAGLAIVGYNYGCARNDNERALAQIVKKPAIVWESKTINLKQKGDLVRQGLESLSLDGKIAVLTEGIAKLDDISEYEVLSSAIANLGEEGKYRVTADGLYGLPEEKSLDLIEGYLSLLDEKPRKDFLIREAGYCNDKSKREIATAYTKGLGKNLGEKIYGAIKGAKIRLSKKQETNGEIELAPEEEPAEKDAEKEN